MIGVLCNDWKYYLALEPRTWPPFASAVDVDPTSARTSELRRRLCFGIDRISAVREQQIAARKSELG